MTLSIITVNFNNRSGLETTFGSIFAQTSKNFEYIVIDGNSTDGSKELILENRNKISKYIIEEDNGIFEAQNKGILNSKGDYLLFLNSGDNLVNEYVIKKILQEKFDSDILYGNIIFQYKNGFKWLRKLPDSLNNRYFYIDSLPHPSTLINRKLFEDLGFYDETYKITSDYNFFLKVFFKTNYTFRHLNYPVSVFHLGGISTSETNKILHKNERNRAFIEIAGIETYNKYKKNHCLISLFQKKLPYLYHLLIGKLSNNYEFPRY